MQGWYVHAEAARLSAEWLASGEIPLELGLDPAEPPRQGEIAHTRRNYLPAGALGRYSFILLPDFKNAGELVGPAEFIFDVWARADEYFVPFNNWRGPIGATDTDLAAQLTAGFSDQVGAAADQPAKVRLNAVLQATMRSVDLFRMLIFGVPQQGFSEKAFFLSDMFRYRLTYEVSIRMFSDAVAADQGADSEFSTAKPAKRRFRNGFQVRTECLPNTYVCKARAPHRMRATAHDFPSDETGRSLTAGACRANAQSEIDWPADGGLN